MKNEKMKMQQQKDFTAYLQSKDLAPSTVTHYAWYVQLFFEFIQKEFLQITKADILKYLEHLKNKKQYENITRRNHLIALNYYFTHLYKTEQITENPCLFLKIRGVKKKTLHKIYTAEELEQLYDNFYHSFIRNFNEKCYASRLGGIPANQRKLTLVCRERNAAVLSILIHQGTTTKEIDRIFLEDIDLQKAVIRIRGGRKSDERNIPLKAPQIGLLMNYTEKIRPQILEYFTTESNKLFLPLPEYSKKNTSNENLMHIFKPLTKQIKNLDKNFLNFKQVRASVITHWLKTQGLRKTQYLAGHRYISSTEEYQPNNLEGLINDIEKHHPF